MAVAHALIVCTQTSGEGGVQRFNRTLLDACGQIGLSCDMYSMGDEGELAGSPVLKRIRDFRGRKLRFTLATLMAIIGGRHDLILIAHVNYLILVAVALRLRLGRRPRVFLVAHGIDVWGNVRGLRRVALRAVTRILCVSHYTRDQLQLQAPEIPAARYSVFPNALSTAWVAQVPSAVPSTLPERFIFSVTRLSRFDRYKGICAVLEALALLEDDQVHYVIAGDGDDRAFLQGCARQLGVMHRVHFLGAVTDQELLGLYSRCAAFVLPSGKEGFGIVYLEAMFFAAPIIAAAARGALDVVHHDETGLLVAYGDVLGLRDAIDRLLRDNGLRERLTAGGRALVTHGGAFTFEAFTTRWADLVKA